MGKSIPLGERVSKAGSLVVRANMHVDAWLAFEERGNNYLKAIERHEPFIKMTFHAHRVTAVVETWSMLDEDDKGTISLPLLARELAINGLISESEADDISSKLKAQPARSKVMRLRHNVIAHRSSKISFDDAFAQVLLSPNQMRALLLEMANSVNRLLAAVGRPLISFIEMAPYVENALASLALR